MFAALTGILASRNRLLGNNFFLRGTSNDIYALDVEGFPVLLKDDSAQFNAIFAMLVQPVPGQIEGSASRTIRAMSVPTVPLQADSTVAIYQREPALFTMNLGPNQASASALLLHFDGADGSNTFTDSSPNALVPTLFGSPTLTTASSQKAFGSAGGNFSASSNTYIRFAPHTALRLPLEFTIRFQYIPSASVLTSKYFFGLSDGTFHVWFTVNGAGNFECYAFGSQTSSTIAPVPGTVYFLALTRDASGQMRWYINTQQQPAMGVSTSVMTSDPFCEIGAVPSLAGGGTGSQAFIDELQVLPNVCAYTTPTITVPTQPFV